MTICINYLKSGSVGFYTAGIGALLRSSAMESSMIPNSKRDRPRGVSPRLAAISARCPASCCGTMRYSLGAAIGSGSAASSGVLCFTASPYIFHHTTTERAEVSLKHYETGGVFRLLPVIRRPISYPADWSGYENFWRFGLATIIGSALRCSVLAWVSAKTCRIHRTLISNVDG